MADRTFAEEIGRALRQLWDTVGSTLGAVGSAQGMDRGDPLDLSAPDPLDSTLSGLAEMLAKLRESDAASFAGSGLVMGSEQSQARVREFLSGFTGQELAGFSRPSGELPSGQVEIRQFGKTFELDPFHKGDLSFLVELLTPAERRIYQQLDPQAAQGYLTGKASQLRQRAAASGGTSDRHQDRFDKMQMGATSDDSDPFADFLNGLLDAISGGGGGGGVGRIYQSPDPAAVRDQIRLMMVGLVGKADDALIQELVDTFMQQDRARVMDNAAIDPSQTVRDRIRQTEAYQRIHKLRPQGVAEEDWLPAYRQVLTAAGIPMTTIDELAVKFAQTGVNPATFTEEGFGARELAETGVARPSLTQSASQVGRALGGLIR